MRSSSVLDKPAAGLPFAFPMLTAVAELQLSSARNKLVLWKPTELHYEEADVLDLAVKEPCGCSL